MITGKYILSCKNNAFAVPKAYPPMVHTLCLWPKPVHHFIKCTFSQSNSFSYMIIVLHIEFHVCESFWMMNSLLIIYEEVFSLLKIGNFNLKNHFWFICFQFCFVFPSQLCDVAPSGRQ